eukprot:CAMPEP_0117075730 /NCGR_PEP_ID=MMETSP0472-20121206/53388_1 /TAXON_ID=693140 ORGANISM="Tiarina fusus, Strain LIS" /NCGR_SAMPLE_ID=MMETSP0472 /ASSEMBLY_ACC=CAM_ASM_000603 /LENGTH=198 /DNA_ID=CAMNT_0004801347 /DNA_START=344 /DNA_END=937 /DNA_ORIENTATION=+
MIISGISFTNLFCPFSQSFPSWIEFIGGKIHAILVDIYFMGNTFEEPADQSDLLVPALMKSATSGSGITIEKLRAIDNIATVLSASSDVVSSSPTFSFKNCLIQNSTYGKFPAIFSFNVTISLNKVRALENNRAQLLSVCPLASVYYGDGLIIGDCVFENNISPVINSPNNKGNVETLTCFNSIFQGNSNYQIASRVA